MKSGIKGFWKKQKNVIKRHRPSSIVPHCPSPNIDFSKIDNGFFNNGFFDLNTLRNVCTVEVHCDKKN